MPRGYRLAIIAALGCLILGQSEQGWTANKQHRHKQTAAQPAAIPNSPDTPSTNSTKKQCYPGSQIGVSCDGISAQAAVDQARDADKQTAALDWQLRVSIATFAAAVAAAAFAWSAAYHTKRGANTSQIGNRAWVSFDALHLGPSFDDSGTPTQLAIYGSFTNVGVSPALDAQAQLDAAVHHSGVDVQKLIYPPLIKPEAGRTVLAPTGNVVCGPFYISFDQYNRFRAGTEKLVVRAGISYKDFDLRQFRETEVGLLLVASPPLHAVIGKERAVVRWEAIGQNNRAT